MSHLCFGPLIVPYRSLIQIRLSSVAGVSIEINGKKGLGLTWQARLGVCSVHCCFLPQAQFKFRDKSYSEGCHC